MVGTRSGARPRAQPHAQGGELVDDHRPNPENSDDDDDDEEIPNTSPSKSKIDPNIRSLDHRRTRSRQLDDDDDRLLQTGQFKRRRLGPVANSRGTHPYQTPVSNSTAHPIGATSPLNESNSSSPEDTGVRAGLVNSVNAVLIKDPEGSQHGKPHVSGGIIAPENGYGHSEADHKNVDGQEQQDHDVADTLRGDGTPSVPLSDPEPVSRPATVLEHDHIVQDNSAEDQAQVDIWDVPVSPEKSRSLKQPDLASSPRESSHRGGRTKGRMPQRRSEPVQSFQLDQAKAAEHPRSASQGDRAPSSTPIQSDVEVESQEGTSEYTERSEDTEHVGGSFRSEESLPEIDPSAEKSFIQDLADFKTRNPEGFNGDEAFEGPAEDDDLATHIDFRSLDMALQLMRQPAWSGLGKGWQKRPFDINSPETKCVRVLLELLAKLERLLVSAPKAPQLMEQNKFLDEHSDLLSYYFSDIKFTLQSIRDRLEKQGSTNTKLHSDIVSRAIPMLFHVLALAWGLGGRDRKHTTFTISTIELLRRTIGWIGLLYHPLLRKLREQPLNVLEDEPKNQKNIRRDERNKREELEKHRKDLCRVIEEGIDGLNQEEQRRKRALQIHQQNLIRQEEITAKQKQENEARMKYIKERQRRSLMSIRGIRIPQSESPIPSSPRQVPSQEPAEVQPSLPDSSDWSLEEKTYLFKKIQESYPDLTDLDDTRWELNRTLDETEKMAEELLGLMLEAVHPEQAAADRNAHIREVMQAYRRTWGHES
ncbi:hypothetical protein F4781DRAFT_432494 [Annulohypoxylon bovei var. microspora]|nr:hypothetical protein F4781DRAFT_432494 [Annulohypoxylon bovei var. microspora]